MPFSDPGLQLADYFFYGVITGTSLVIVAILLMWRAARWEIDNTVEHIIEETRDSERELAEQLRKYQLENEHLRDELERLRDGPASGRRGPRPA